MARKTVFQRHHITYGDGRESERATERVVKVTKGEHLILTRLQWLKSVSPGFVPALMYELSKKPYREVPDDAKN